MQHGDGGWVLQWWQAKASSFEQYVNGVRAGAGVDPDLIAAPAVVRLLSAQSPHELADQACAAWDDVHRLARSGAAPQVLAAVTVRMAMAYASRVEDLLTEVGEQLASPMTPPSREAGGC